MDFLTSPEFWVALGQIIIIDILLGGDNAVVIALACRKLPPAQRTKGIIWGTAGAIADRHTIDVDPSVSDALSRLSPGQRIDIVCAEEPTGALDTGAATPAPDPLGSCTRVAAILTPAAGSSRGR